MKSIYKLPLLLSGFLLFSCNDFGDINENPNEPTFVNTASLLTSAESFISFHLANPIPLLYAQHLSEITYTEDSRYGSVRADFNRYYTQPLADLQRIIDLNTNEASKSIASKNGSNSDQIAIANILKSFFFIHMTDSWGPIPFDDALKGSAVLLPKYNSVQEIYTKTFDILKTASKSLKGGHIGGDILFDGDVDQWAKFANTLRAVMAIRIADVDAAKGKSEYLAAVADGIADEDMVYHHLAEANNENPWFSYFRSRKDYAISNILADALEERHDPRLLHFADPTEADMDVIAGMPYGLENSDYNPVKVSFPHSQFFKAQDGSLPIFTHAQLLFCAAEAAARGWTATNPNGLYEEAITASMHQWHIDDAKEIDDYLAQPNVKYNASNWKESIAMQKWIALYSQGHEAWTEWRRLDFPNLKPAEAPLNTSRQIPLRMQYPSSEATLNKANLDAAIQSLGGADTDGKKLWWDIK